MRGIIAAMGLSLCACAPEPWDRRLDVSSLSAEDKATVREAAEAWRTTCGYEIALGTSGTKVTIKETLDQNDCPGAAVVGLLGGCTEVPEYGFLKVTPVATRVALMHEIGHLLFGAEHTDHGIMRAVSDGKGELTSEDCLDP